MIKRINDEELYFRKKGRVAYVLDAPFTYSMFSRKGKHFVNDLEYYSSLGVVKTKKWKYGNKKLIRGVV